MSLSLTDQLQQGAEQIGCELSDVQQGTLLDYLALIEKWNKVYNLTAVRNVDDMIEAHLLDSLSVLPHLHGDQCIDVGSGAGLPGIPLAIVDPQRHWLLIDSQIKRTRFQQQAVAELQLKNVNVEHARVQDATVETLASTIICRAYSSLADFVRDSRHLCSPDGVLLAMKADYPDKEIAELSADIEVIEVLKLPAGAQHKQRHLVKMRARPELD